jgi:hypothetical protein
MATAAHAYPPATACPGEADPPVNTGMVIKLRGNGPNPGIQGFMQDYEAATQPNPMNDRQRLYGPIGIMLYSFGNGIHLEDIVALSEPGKGHATKALTFLKQLADKHRVRLEGTAKAYLDHDQHRVTQTNDLVRWYKKNGFDILGGDPEDGYEIQYIPEDLDLRRRAGLI